MALSFLFGKKKTAAEESPSSENKPSVYDDYVVIERKTEPPPSDNMYPMLGPGSSVTLPYQVLPSNPAAGALPTSADSHSCNPLDDVPFKLNSSLTGGSCEWSRNDAAHFKSVVSRAVHHNETVYKYDFSHEKSIMRETNQGSVDVG